MGTGSDKRGRVRAFRYIPLYGEGFGTFHGGFEEMTISEYEYWGYSPALVERKEEAGEIVSPAVVVSTRKGFLMSAFEWAKLGFSMFALVVVSALTFFTVERLAAAPGVRGAGCQCDSLHIDRRLLDLESVFGAHRADVDTRWEEFRARLKALESRPYRIGSAGESK